MVVDNPAELAGPLAEGDIPLGTFSEKELAAVTGPDAPTGRLVPLRLDALPTAERIAALVDGHHCLRDRGLLDHASTPTGGLRVILPIRARPRMIAIADRDLRGVAEHRYLYSAILPDELEVVLEETVDAEGAHAFTLRSQASAAAELAAFVDPEAQALQDGPPRYGRGVAAHKHWPEVQAAMTSAEVVTRLFSTRRRASSTDPEEPPQADQPRSWRASLAAGPDGVLIIAGYTPASENQAAHSTVLFAQALSRQSLGRLLAAFIHPTLSP